MEEYLSLFEDAINVQKKQVGAKKALAQAKKAGLSVSAAGHIVACTGNPAVVLLRLIRTFTEDGNLAALHAVAPLIEKLSSMQDELSPTLD
jgi:hypothetical protein